jgi:exopolysaccharide biosynthesis protein
MKFLNIGNHTIFTADGEMVFPGQSYEKDEIGDFEKRQIAEGDLEIEDDRSATKEIAEEINSKKKKVKKSIAEAEDGGEFK